MEPKVYKFKYFYLATGMEGVPDEREWCTYANDPKFAWRGWFEFMRANTDSDKSWVISATTTNAPPYKDLV